MIDVDAIAELMGVDTSEMETTLEEMMDRGYVDFAIGLDGRRKWVLTPRGVAEAERIKEGFLARVAQN